MAIARARLRKEVGAWLWDPLTMFTWYVRTQL
jgi:hypothetical protein